MKKRSLTSILSLLLLLAMLLAHTSLLISCVDDATTNEGSGSDDTTDGGDDASDSNGNEEDTPNPDENENVGDELVLEETTPLYAENASDLKIADTNGKPVFNANFCKDFEMLPTLPQITSLRKKRTTLPLRR